MGMILSMVQRITVFMLAATLFTNLFSGTEYKKYFQYATGLIVTALVLSPVLSLFGEKSNVDEWLGLVVFEQETEQTKEDIRLLGEQYEQAIQERYTKQVREDVAGQCGAEPENCDVVVTEGKLERITVRLQKRPDNVTSLISRLAARYGIDRDNIFIIQQ
ncbi:MAG: stage III sporulation protein AF [Lachnospiraceae bacterium]|nr:stage III sporulation protein AF [Lachnospiraceae bacterium]